MILFLILWISLHVYCSGSQFLQRVKGVKKLLLVSVCSLWPKFLTLLSIILMQINLWCKMQISQGSNSDWKTLKMGRHFPVTEKSGNFEQTRKVRENYTKYWTTMGISKQMLFLVIFKSTVYEAGYEQCLRPASCVCVLRAASC